MFSENIWRFHTALSEDCLVVELGQRASRSGLGGLSIPGWPLPAQKAAVLPIRLREDSEAAAFLVLGIHPGRAFDDTYRDFVRRIAEQIAIGLASARAHEQERRRAEALAEIDRAKTAFFQQCQPRVPYSSRPDARSTRGSVAGSPRAAKSGTSRAVGHGPPKRGQVAKLVNRLLDFSRIEAGRAQAVYEPTDLSGLTAEIASVYRSAMENAGLQFAVECPPIGEPVYVDRDMWEKVVSNLLSNAFKFTFEGSVAVTLKALDGAVRLQVRDAGVGIPEEHRERVFERFHRIEGTQARTFEGTGIGLAFVQEVVKLHGGDVRVGHGSTFTVTITLGTMHLPPECIQAAQSVASPGATAGVYAAVYSNEAQGWLADEWGLGDVAALPKSASVVPVPRPEPVAGRELIVVADDNADMRKYLRHLLDGRYEVHTVSDGRQALDTTRRLRPALLLADVMMPQSDGFGLLRAVRDDAVLAGTPIILLSTRAGEESRLEGLQAGADDYLVKPFTARELMARVEVHLKLAKLRRETAEREERLWMEAELERQRLNASQDLLLETTRLYQELQEREAEIRKLKDRLHRENLALRDEVDRASMFV